MKIIIIGCPGSGKSTFSRKLNNTLNYPILHLDKIYHTGIGKEHITREELVIKVNNFINDNNNWIIDGTYTSTLEGRVKACDTVIFFDIDTNTCLENVKSRSKSKDNRADMAYGFDESITEDFINRIKVFKSTKFLRIKEMLNKYVNKQVIIIDSYDKIDEIIKYLNGKQ